MKGWAVDFLDFKATVSVLLYKRGKMEVKYLPCVWCILMLGAEPCLKTYEYHPWHWTLHCQRKYHFSNYKQFWKQVVSDWKKRHFYFISPVSEAMIWFKPWNIISLKTADGNLPYFFFVFYFIKNDQLLAWFVKLNHAKERGRSKLKACNIFKVQIKSLVYYSSSSLGGMWIFDSYACVFSKLRFK